MQFNPFEWRRTSFMKYHILWWQHVQPLIAACAAAYWPTCGNIRVFRRLYQLRHNVNMVSIGPFHLISTPPPPLTRFLIFNPLRSFFFKNPSENHCFSRNPLRKFQYFSTPLEHLLTMSCANNPPKKNVKIFDPPRKFSVISQPP